MRAIRHICVVGCVYMSQSCRMYRVKNCPQLMKVCVKRCMDPKALKKAVAAAVPSNWGLTKKSAINVCTPAGERRFLATLRCLDGSTPSFSRSGSVGARNQVKKLSLGSLSYFRTLAPGQTDTHVIDLYQVVCPAKTHSLYLDMYHCMDGPQPWAAPKGFTRPVP